MKSLLHKEFAVQQDDYANAGKASSAIKQTLATIGMNPKVLRRIAIATYESEINMIIHAYGGVITLDVDEEGGVHLEFKDTGPGIPDIAKAMTPGFSTASDKARELGFGAGMGLPNIKSVSDEFDLKSSEAGTTLTLLFRETI